MPKLPGMTIKNYLKSKGAMCPFCGRFEMSGEDYKEAAPGILLQAITCLNCGEEWQDQYTLSSIVGTESLDTQKRRYKKRKRPIE